MRRLFSLLTVVLLALVPAACGSSSSSSANGTLSRELSYFDPSAPLVMVLQTDPGGAAIQNANAFLGRFPFAKLGISAAENNLARSGLDYQRDIKPLLGNPVALGAASAGSLSGSKFLLVFVAKDASKLSALTTRSPAPQSEGSYDGAKLYQGGTYALAINGSTAVLTPSLGDLRAALDRHAHSSGITAAEYTRALTGLPQSALLTVYGNLAGLLSTQKAANARLVPWVAAIRSYAATVGGTAASITVSYRIDTSGATLTADQLPLPSGSLAPGVAAGAPVAVGVSDLAHVLSFGLAAERATSPAGYSAFLARQASVRAKTGVDITNDVFSQFSGNLEIDYAPAGVMARADVRDPAAAARTLAKLGTSAGLVFRHAKQVSPVGNGFYVTRDGTQTVTFGLVGSHFVLGTVSAAALSAFARAPTSPVAGAQGPVAFRVALEPIIALAMAGRNSSAASNPAVQTVLGMFSDATGWAANDPSGLHGALSVSIK